jgi:hypothetical protein
VLPLTSAKRMARTLLVMSALREYTSTGAAPPRAALDPLPAAPEAHRTDFPRRA